MICEHCGVDIEDGKNTNCPQCGADLHDDLCADSHFDECRTEEGD